MDDFVEDGIHPPTSFYFANNLRHHPQSAHGPSVFFLRSLRIQTMPVLRMVLSLSDRLRPSGTVHAARFTAVSGWVETQVIARPASRCATGGEVG